MRGLSTSIAFYFLLASCSAAQSARAQQTVYWEADHLAATKQKLTAADKSLRTTLNNLRRSADEALLRGPYSVVQKQEVPPSGDKHDYLSYSRYWWPNPDTHDGLPYVRHDGRTNVKARAKGDRDRIGQLFIDVEVLTLAYYFFEEEKYAEHACLLLRTWFLDPDTRMNPNLNFGQAVLGRSEGRGVGIIDTRGFIVLLDCVALLDESPSFSASDNAGLRRWFREFLVWLRTSKLGKDEQAASNNHGSWYAAQTARIALFVGEEELAREIVEHTKTIRIPDQFKADGSQPYENERTKSLHYCFFNFTALSVVARVGEQLGLDLWNANAAGGGSMKAGLAYLLPFLTNQERWPHQQLERYAIAPKTIQLLRMASVRYENPDFAKVISQVEHRHEEANFASLVCEVNTNQNGNKKTPQVSVLEGEKPSLKRFELPAISEYTQENIEKLMPAALNGTATVGPSQGERVLEESFRKNRGVDLQKRQGTANTRVIKISGGAINLPQLVQQIDDPAIASRQGSTVTVRLPLFIQPSGVLVVDGTDVNELRLSTDRGAFIANSGILFVIDSKLTSWNEDKAEPSYFLSEKQFRPFVSSYIRSQTYLAGSEIEHLGYLAPTAYGLSLSSNPERNRGEPSNDWPMGLIVNSRFKGMYYGFYSFEARDVAIVGNTYEDSIRYGIDPHDRSTRLIIAENVAKGTRERHGIIGSREISDSFIFRNKSFENKGSGIMLDRQCSNNVISDNEVYNNGQGIAVYESSNNIVASNRVFFNNGSGIRVRNSREIAIQENIVAGNNDYGFEIYSKRLDDHDKRAQRGDLYTSFVAASIHANVVTGNKGGCIKGNDVDLLQLSDFRTQLDAATISQLNDNFHEDLDGSDDKKFGSQLKPYSEQFRKVLDDPQRVVEYRSN